MEKQPARRRVEGRIVQQAVRAKVLWQNSGRKGEGHRRGGRGCQKSNLVKRPLPKTSLRLADCSECQSALLSKNLSFQTNLVLHGESAGREEVRVKCLVEKKGPPS